MTVRGEARSTFSKQRVLFDRAQAILQKLQAIFKIDTAQIQITRPKYLRLFDPKQDLSSSAGYKPIGWENAKHIKPPPIETKTSQGKPEKFKTSWLFDPKTLRRGPKEPPQKPPAVLVNVPNVPIPIAPLVNVPNVIVPSAPPVKVQNVPIPSAPLVKVQNAIVPSAPPVKVPNVPIPSAPPVKVQNVIVPSAPPVNVQTVPIPNAPLVNVQTVPGTGTAIAPGGRQPQKALPAEIQQVPTHGGSSPKDSRFSQRITPTRLTFEPEHPHIKETTVKPQPDSGKHVSSSTKTISRQAHDLPGSAHASIKEVQDPKPPTSRETSSQKNIPSSAANATLHQSKHSTQFQHIRALLTEHTASSSRFHRHTTPKDNPSSNQSRRSLTQEPRVERLSSSEGSPDHERLMASSAHSPSSKQSRRSLTQGSRVERPSSSEGSPAREMSMASSAHSPSSKQSRRSRTQGSRAERPSSSEGSPAREMVNGLISS